MKTGKKYSTLLTFNFFLFTSLLVGCKRDPSNGRLRASGTLEMTEVYLSPSVTGKISTVTVQEGQSVSAGQRVATLDRFEQAEREYERARRLLPEGGATREQLEHAELAFKDQQLVSPMDGTVLLRVSEPGEVISPTIPVVVIGNPRDVWMKIYIAERDIGKVMLGQVAHVFVDAFPKRPFTGKATFISPKAEFTPKNIQTKEERVTQMFAVKITLDHPDGILKPGMPADCEILTSVSGETSLSPSPLVGEGEDEGVKPRKTSPHPHPLPQGERGLNKKGKG